MSRGSMLVLFGGLVALSPFFGLPLAVLSWFLPIVGLLVLLIGVSYRFRHQRRRSSVSLSHSHEDTQTIS